MENISRDAILRMVGRNAGNGGSGGNGGGAIDMSGYATQIWTEQNYVGKEFFSSLFKAYDSNGNEILPNDTDSTIDNIKAMFGFWTDFYVSALGTGGQSTVGLRLAQLADVNVAGVTNGQVLTYDSTTGKWIAATPQSGTDMATVWANLAASDSSKQIDISHLTTALDGYAHTSDIPTNNNQLTNGAGYITSSGSCAYATSAGSAASATTADQLNGNYNKGASTWDWNPFNLTNQYWVWGQKFQDNGIGGDSGDIRFYLTQLNVSGGVGLCMNLDGRIATLGMIYSGEGFYTSGYVTALSDARHKDIIGDTGLTVEDIAEAPAIRFQWNDRDDKTVFAGSIAQYWQKVLPEVVQSQADGTLSLDYQVAALISSITVARKVVNHEERIKQLEKENKELKERLNIV